MSWAIPRLNSNVIQTGSTPCTGISKPNEMAYLILKITPINTKDKSWQFIKEADSLSLQMNLYDKSIASNYNGFNKLSTRFAFHYIQTSPSLRVSFKFL